MAKGAPGGGWLDFIGRSGDFALMANDQSFAGASGSHSQNETRLRSLCN
jgi:hypothetical protein